LLRSLLKKFISISLIFTILSFPAQGNEIDFAEKYKEKLGAMNYGPMIDKSLRALIVLSTVAMVVESSWGLSCTVGGNSEEELEKSIECTKQLLLPLLPTVGAAELFTAILIKRKLQDQNRAFPIGLLTITTLLTVPTLAVGIAALAQCDNSDVHTSYLCYGNLGMPAFFLSFPTAISHFLTMLLPMLFMQS